MAEQQKKYEFTGETKTLEDGTVVRRIRALVDLPNPHGMIKAGTLGGWIESEKNLPVPTGEDADTFSAWVADKAIVCGEAIVVEGALVSDEAQVSEWAMIHDGAHVGGRVWVNGYAHVGGKAFVDSGAYITGDAKITGAARISDNVRVGDRAVISGDAKILDYASIIGEAVVSNSVTLKGWAELTKKHQYITVSPLLDGSEVTFYPNKKNEICVDGVVCYPSEEDFMYDGCTLQSFLSFLDDVFTGEKPEEVQRFLQAADFARSVIDLSPLVEDD